MIATLFCYLMLSLEYILILQQTCKWLPTASNVGKHTAEVAVLSAAQNIAGLILLACHRADLEVAYITITVSIFT